MVLIHNQPLPLPRAVHAFCKGATNLEYFKKGGGGGGGQLQTVSGGALEDNV